MLKNGKPYGDIIPPDVYSMRVKDVKLGDKAELQIIALTNHSVGRKRSWFSKSKLVNFIFAQHALTYSTMKQLTINPGTLTVETASDS